MRRAVATWATLGVPAGCRCSRAPRPPCAL